MKPVRTKQVAIRLADPAYDLLTELAADDGRPITQMAWRLLIEKLAERAAARQQAAGTGAGAATAAAA
jgi:hypothetical protein